MTHTLISLRSKDTPHKAPRIGWRQSLSRKIAVTDALVLVITFSVAMALKFDFDARPQAVGPISINYFTFGAVLGASWWVSLSVFGTRDPRILGEDITEYRSVVRVSILLFGWLAIATLMLKWDMSRGFLAIAFPFGVASLLTSRKAWRVWLRSARQRGKHFSKVLVIGGPRAIERLASKFNSAPVNGLRVTGAWVPDIPEGFESWVDSNGHAVPVMGNSFDLLQAVSIAEADTVIVTDSEHLGPEGIRDLTWQMDSLDIDLMVSPNLVDIAAPRMHMGSVGDEPFIHLEQPRYAEAGNWEKWCFDTIVGALLLLPALPILAAAVAAIKLTSAGPAFFVQHRVGLDGRTFRILKLRTMRVDADELLASLLDDQGSATEPLFKVADDPRITPVGSILRRFSIDELPQLLNVLKGDMSLVGPRPQRNEEVELYNHRDERRLTVRPGMTGLWQVSGRSDLDWSEAIKLDLYYVENWSMTGDLLILWKTVRAVLQARGAY